MDDTTCSSSGNKAELSEYERQRLENIAEMQFVLKDVYENVTQSVKDLATSFGSASRGTKRPLKSQQLGQVKSQVKAKVKAVLTCRRSKRPRREVSNYFEPYDSEDENSKNTKRNKAYTDFTDSDFISDDENNDHTTILQYSGRKHQALRVSQITQDMLKNIANSFTDKIYDRVNGTTCHQCRKKTLDQKSICRYKNCRGGRGMFCGLCLNNRYGEHVAEVLLNKKWVCPVCCDVCNCSICRRRKGKLPTGPLPDVARDNVYKSVRHFLEITEG